MRGAAVEKVPSTSAGRSIIFTPSVPGIPIEDWPTSKSIKAGHRPLRTLK